MRVLVVDAQSGISGDMFVAAAARLAGCEDEVVALPGRLGLPAVTCAFRDVVRASMRGRAFEVQEESRPADGGHEHRSLSTILGMISGAGLEAGVADRTRRMFERLGEVEAEAHGIPVERVHFHEVGAVDSILDIVAASLCIERLGLEAAYSSAVCVGGGVVRTAHGTLPVPAPATERLLRGMPTVTGDLEGEWTTPTGALILAELAVGFDIPTIVTLDSACGAGGRDPAGRPNLLRLRLARADAPPQGELESAGLERDELVAIRCNIDDSTGELLGAEFLDTLLAAGARDAVIQPVIMKKGRPGQLLEVLVDPDRAEELAALVLASTSSIGVRMHRVSRLKLPRATRVVATAYGDVEAKIVHLPSGKRRIKPEHESCRARAHEHGVTVQEVYQAALRAAEA